MRKLFILLLLIGSITTCKKKDSGPPNSNEMKATGVFSSGHAFNFTAKGSNVKMGTGCTLIGGYVTGTNESHAIVSISTTTLTSPGTFAFICEYRANDLVADTPIYEGSGSGLTITSINDHYLAGYFTVVCRCISTGCVLGVDSVIVSGTFKGDHIN